MKPAPDDHLFYIDRITGERKREEIYGRLLIDAFYGGGLFARCLSPMLLPIVVRVPVFSQLFGLLQKSSWSQRSIEPFIQKYGVNREEMLEPESFRSFNDFFERKLKPEARPIAAPSNPSIAVSPADGRSLVFPHLSDIDYLPVKHQHLSLLELLDDKELVQQFEGGSAFLVRLCPIDYHRCHMPVTGRPGKAQRIEGALYSVNPLALRKNLTILTSNKRDLIPIESEQFGKLLLIMVGATCVGTTFYSYHPGQLLPKGAELGGFSFGGSLIILLFQKGKMGFDQDLVRASMGVERLETLVQMGQSIGRSS